MSFIETVSTLSRRALGLLALAPALLAGCFAWYTLIRNNYESRACLFCSADDAMNWERWMFVSAWLIAFGAFALFLSVAARFIQANAKKLANFWRLTFSQKKEWSDLSESFAT